jgi:hypothetical protein
MRHTAAYEVSLLPYTGRWEGRKRGDRRARAGRMTQVAEHTVHRTVSLTPAVLPPPPRRRSALRLSCLQTLVLIARQLRFAHAHADAFLPSTVVRIARASIRQRLADISATFLGIAIYRGHHEPAVGMPHVCGVGISTQRACRATLPPHERKRWDIYSLHITEVWYTFNTGNYGGRPPDAEHRTAAAMPTAAGIMGVRIRII